MVKIIFIFIPIGTGLLILLPNKTNLFLIIIYLIYINFTYCHYFLVALARFSFCYYYILFALIRFIFNYI